MSGSATTMAPHQRSPALARRRVHRELSAAGLDHLIDDALLLVTELVTNAVVHAGTAFELALDTTPPGLRAEVVDHSPGGPPAPRAAGDPASEHGRGLVILEALATRWGTTHTASTKSVWFELERPVPARPPGRATVPGARRAEAAGARTDAAWALALPADLEARLSTSQVLAELVHRVGDALDLDDAHLVLAEQGARGWALEAVRGEVPGEEALAAAWRRSAGTGEAVLRTGTDLLVPLRGRGEHLGVLVLPGAHDLGGSGTALARLVAERLAVLVRELRADEAEDRERGSLALLAEASEMFATTLDVRLAAALATQLVVPRFARWAALLTLSDREPRLEAVTHAEEDRVAGLRAALTSAAGRALVGGLEQALRGQQPVLLPPSSLPVADGSSEVLVLPLVARRRLLGALLVGQEGGPSASSDVPVLLDLARRAALAVDGARLYEEQAAVAHALQASLLPPELPRAPHVDFGARYVAAGEGNEVGGDFYDVFSLPDGGWAVAIGDVCGKGAAAAAITGLARNVLRLLLRQGRAPSACLRELNEAILDLDERGRFVTGAVATLHPDGPGLRVRFCVAGHPSPVRTGAGGPPALIGHNGTVLGVTDAVDLVDEEVRLEAGEALVLYTDGVTERRRGLVMFGEETLLDVLAGLGDVSADAVAGCVEQAVRSFGPEASRDDLAVLVVRATGGGA